MIWDSRPEFEPGVFMRKPKRAKQSQPEGQVVNACIRWLWAHGVFCWRQNTGAYKPEGSNRYIRFGTPGCADIIGVTKHGRFIAVECKTAKGKLSPLQELFRQHIHEHDGIYITARGIDDLEARKPEILAALYRPAIAEGAEHDYRIRPIATATRQMEEAGA